MPTTRTNTIYQFDELDEKAKEKAILRDAEAKAEDT